MSELEREIGQCRKVITIEVVKDNEAVRPPEYGPVGALLAACGWSYLGTERGRAYFGLPALEARQTG